MAIALVWVALTPFDPTALGSLGHWYRHYPAHFVAFAALGAVWTLGFRRASLVAVAFAMVAFAFAHEVLEIMGHAHRFEMHDAVVNALGVLTGVACASAVMKSRGRRQYS